MDIMNIAQKQRDDIADGVLWKKRSLSYAEVHQCGWKDAYHCESYIVNRWPHGGISKRTITIRTNKLWAAASKALNVKDYVEIENSLWKVDWSLTLAISKGIPPQIRNKRHWNEHIVEDPEIFSTLGYVIASDAFSAKMAAAITLGPRAQNDFIRVTRIGVGDWSAANELNRGLLKSYNKTLNWATESLEQKKWELEQIKCQIAFLEIGATFEQAAAPDINL